MITVVRNASKAVLFQQNVKISILIFNLEKIIQNVFIRSLRVH